MTAETSTSHKNAVKIQTKEQKRKKKKIEQLTMRKKIPGYSNSKLEKFSANFLVVVRDAKTRTTHGMGGIWAASI